MEHCHYFSAITMQLLHDMGAIFLSLIMMGPQIRVSNCGRKEYILVRPTTSIGGVNMVTLYE
jgi:hypothetical protein